GSARSFHRRSPMSVSAGMCARTRISENAALNFATCSGAKDELGGETTVTPVGAGLTLAQRLRDVLLSPNAIRTVAVAVFFVVWEYYGRRMDPIFMAPPSAIFAAAMELIRSRALEKALIQTLWPFAVGMALTVVVGIALGIVMAQWRTLEYVL